ncbi:hypothetical protein [Mycobacterium deserti]|uniref:DUF4178 domain-containing protein n=1 Tax=Mycobacterium deserti TaxID=2978347 RepID=A0ABT2MKB8_9MYCO|nr:hypothetical protein [Mycobacterium deserti]MCT7661426.1 hypothetical protein [Mycobacterium deserti]
MAAEETESVPPEQIEDGDVICDQLGKRWLTVSEITVDDNHVFAFYGGGPDDRMAFEESELVRRRSH